MQEAINKLQSEMDGKESNDYIKLIGNFLIQHIQANPAAAEKVLAADKTIAKSLAEMAQEARKKVSVGGMTMLTDQEGYSVVLKYFGIEDALIMIQTNPTAPNENSENKFDVSLDDLLG
ncbi:Cas9 inhibitor AcrIIA9 family protein [Paenibacillus chibensis]|uniref:Cas9 inhibitor AcrIIA9 family protein n=1 Tax=Paenibacillus chibensis TaxID=59846 RepID=UPI000FD875FF|nr:Cas9 inhibitor AcrIIA9 family protein [Paenibacillus chibensis]MEC0370863.1 Cas9 inhibitor AcrIIA9 family protein [Paenibacillus chibensis]